MAPIPTIEITLGVFKIGIRAAGVNRVNTYPGKRGSSTLFIRSDHRRRLVYSGRKHSYVWYWSSEVTRFSWVLLTCTANQGKPYDACAVSVDIETNSRQRSHRLRFFGLIFPATQSEDVVAQELHSDTVTAVPLRLHAQNRSAGAETKNSTLRTLGRGQPHGNRHQGSFAYHPFEPQV